MIHAPIPKSITGKKRFPTPIPIAYYLHRSCAMRDRLFDNLDIIAALAALRMFLPDRIGSPIWKVTLDGQLSPYKGRNPAARRQRSQKIKYSVGVNLSTSRRIGQARTKAPSHKGWKHKHNPFASSRLRVSPITALPASGRAKTVPWPQL